jgi:hypothetical protein
MVLMFEEKLVKNSYQRIKDNKEFYVRGGSNYDPYPKPPKTGVLAVVDLQNSS